MGRKPADGYRVRKQVTVRIESAEWADRKGLDFSELLDGKIRELMKREEEALTAQAIEESRHKDDLGPKTAIEAAAYLAWFDNHPEVRPLPHMLRFKAWRESMVVP